MSLMPDWIENSIGVVDDKWDATTGGFVYLSAIYLEIEERRRNKGILHVDAVQRVQEHI